MNIILPTMIYDPNLRGCFSGYMHMRLKRSYDTYNHTEHVIARPQPDWYHTIGIDSLVDYVL